MQKETAVRPVLRLWARNSVLRIWNFSSFYDSVDEEYGTYLYSVCIYQLLNMETIEHQMETNTFLEFANDFIPCSWPWLPILVAFFPSCLAFIVQKFLLNRARTTWQNMPNLLFCPQIKFKISNLSLSLPTLYSVYSDRPSFWCHHGKKRFFKTFKNTNCVQKHKKWKSTIF